MLFYKAVGLVCRQVGPGLCNVKQQHVDVCKVGVLRGRGRYLLYSTSAGYKLQNGECIINFLVSRRCSYERPYVHMDAVSILR